MYDLVILAGGKGTRISSHLKGNPKPLVKINNIHFLDYLLFTISKFFFANIFIISGFKGNLIKKKYHNTRINLSPIKVISEKKLKGTGGALYEVKKLVKNDFFLINGDSIFEIDFYDLIKKFDKKKYIASIALTKNKNYLSNKKLNSLFIKKNSQITLLKNKKQKYMNGGVYFFNKSFLKFVENKESSLENDILPNLINDKKICGKYYNNHFLDIGTPKNLKIAKIYFKKIFFKPAIFLDRDGTINHDKGYIHKIKDLRLIKKTVKYLKTKKNNYFFIVTNQAGIAKKKFKIDDFFKFQNTLFKYLKKEKIYINDTKLCLHHTNSLIKKFKKKCKCRKPNNKMITDILNYWPINKKKSLMIGDRESDYIAATKSNLKFKYVADI